MFKKIVANQLKIKILLELIFGNHRLINILLKKMKKKYMKQILTVQGVREIHIPMEKLLLIKEKVMGENIIIHLTVLIDVDGKQVLLLNTMKKILINYVLSVKMGLST